jgi:Type ISP C-terminal specificity domain
VSATLGSQLAALLDPEKPVAEVTESPVRLEIRSIGVISAVNGKLDPEHDLYLTAGWGYVGRGGITMPAQGKVVRRPYTPEELSEFESGAAVHSLSLDEILELLGPETFDVHLNDRAFWRNVPLHVWEYTLGGYQVIKKWLSYREKPLLDRSLRTDEVRYVAEVARRIAAILILGPTLDANYRAVAQASRDWTRIPT